MPPLNKLVPVLNLLMVAYVFYLKSIYGHLHALVAQLFAIPGFPSALRLEYLRLADAMFWPTLLLAASSFGVSLLAAASKGINSILAWSIVALSLGSVMMALLVT